MEDCKNCKLIKQDSAVWRLPPVGCPYGAPVTGIYRLHLITELPGFSFDLEVI